jgi:hypothetical protein
MTTISGLTILAQKIHNKPLFSGSPMNDMGKFSVGAAMLRAFSSPHFHRT